MKQFRHGDVLIEEISALPAELEKLSHRILAHGEETGHSHRLRQPERGQLLEGAAGLFLHVQQEGVAVIHEEHAPIDLPPGFYRVWRQREYTPKEIRIVRD